MDSLDVLGVILIIVVTMAFGALIGAIYTDAPAVRAAKQSMYNAACMETCGTKDVRNFHSADKNLCVCNDGKTYKYNLKGLYHGR